MSWIEQKQQWIEAAARTLWAGAWAYYMENEYCSVCDAERGTYPGVHDNYAEDGHEFKGASFSGQELTDIAPPTPDYARLCAAELLGMIEQANGCGLEVIIDAATKADIAELKDDIQPTETFGTLNYVAEFASDCAMMAMDTGVSWFDDHAKFSLPCNHQSSPATRHGPLGTPCRPFVVPSYEFTYEGE